VGNYDRSKVMVMMLVLMIWGLPLVVVITMHVINVSMDMLCDKSGWWIPLVDQLSLGLLLGAKQICPA
jgi:hypothetical protein